MWGIEYSICCCVISFFGLEGKNPLLVFGRQISIPKISSLHLLNFTGWSGRLTIAQTGVQVMSFCRKLPCVSRILFHFIIFFSSSFSSSKTIHTKGGHKIKISCSHQSSGFEIKKKPSVYVLEFLVNEVIYVRAGNVQNSTG